MHIKVLGPGCKNCHTVERNTRTALERLGWDAEVELVTDYADIAGYGIMKTPGLVVDEQVVSAGMVPDADAIEKLLRQVRPS